jgi:iron complex transport system permease protein
MKKFNDLKDSNKYFIGLLTLFIILSILIFFASLAIGRYQVPFGDTLSFIFNNAQIAGTNSYNILLYYRLPRTSAAFVVGIALSASGLMYQTIFNNQLVSPDILGVSSGSCVGASVAILFGLDNALVVLLAFVTGIAAVLLSLLIPRMMKNKSTTILVISGIVVGSLMSSILGLIKYIADGSNKLADITFWTMGSMARIDWRQFAFVAPLILILTIILFPLSWKSNILSLGRNEAKSVGINYSVYRLAFIAISTLLTAAAVSLCGSVGWVGLVVPHISRALIGSNNKKVLPVCTLTGGIFMMITESISRNVTTTEIPLSIITGIFGAVFFSVFMCRLGRRVHD